MNMATVNGTKQVGRIPVMEIFGPTIQGEGLMSGTVTHFLRTGGCGLRCTWCDTLWAVEPKQIKANRTMMTINDIIAQLKELPTAPYLTLTGGDPCLHKGLGELITPANALGMEVAIETQGQLFPDWLPHADVITFSPKGPSSGNTVDTHDMINWISQQMRGNKRRQRICIKVVIFNEEDFKYAMTLYRIMPPQFYDAFYFTAGTPMLENEVPPKGEEEMTDYINFKVNGVLVNQQALAKLMLKDYNAIYFNSKVKMGCQQHVLLWPDKHKGV